jgi:hypothetical protein
MAGALAMEIVVTQGTAAQSDQRYRRKLRKAAGAR